MLLIQEIEWSWQINGLSITAYVSERVHGSNGTFVWWLLWNESVLAKINDYIIPFSHKGERKYSSYWSLEFKSVLILEHKQANHLEHYLWNAKYECRILITNAEIVHISSTIWILAGILTPLWHKKVIFIQAMLTKRSSLFFKIPKALKA